MNHRLELVVPGAKLLLSVRRFTVRERVSEPFSVELVVRSTFELDFEDVIGQEARFEARFADRDGGPRTWSGHIVQLEHVGGDRDGVFVYVVQLVAKLWLLSQNRSYRVFQRQTELEVATSLLEEWGIAVEVEVDPARFLARQYLVQYAECDLAVVHRCFEAAGLSYFIADAGGEETVVVTDEPQERSPEPPLTFLDAADMHLAGRFATEVNITRRVRPGRYAMQDLDYRRPTTPPLRVDAQLRSVSGIEQRLERYQYVPGSSHVEATADDTPIADDRGATRTNERYARELARLRLEAKQASRIRVTFETNAFELRPGAVVPIQGHGHAQLDAPVLVLATTFEGADVGEWTLRCEALPVGVPFRPPLVTPRPRAQGLESATVVGAPGQELHTDEFGRVRVQFHWDREGTHDDRSTCWIPVSQSWAGAGYGSVQLPRVGQEVLVDFLGGDVDRPVIVGRVYTRLQQVPYRLPEHQSTTVICRTKTLGGDGYNEIAADDTAGAEQLRLRAERDLRVLVQNRESRTVGGTRAVSVGRDDVKTVGKDCSLTVKGTSTFTADTDDPSGGVPTELTCKNGELGLVVGSSSISVTPDSIDLTATTIRLTATTIEIVGTSEVKVDGGLIKLNC